MPNTPQARFAGRLVLTLALGLGLAGPLAAQDREVLVERERTDVRTISVQTSDLDLNSAYDRDTLEIRINQAADAVCDVNGGSKIDKLPDARACVNLARAQAFDQIEARGVQVAAQTATHDRRE